MLTKEKKSEIFGCILNQFPDSGIYRITRLTEWLSTNGYSLPKMGYDSFRSFAEDFPEALQLHPTDGGNTYVIIKSWDGAAKRNADEHPADSFFGSHSLILNDDIIEMSQQSLYALTKVLGVGLSVQEMKQRVYDRFAQAKQTDSLSFFAERYTFPIDYCLDGFLVNGIITKNLSPRGKSLYFSFEKTAIFSGDSVQSLAPAPAQDRYVSEEDKREIYQLLSAAFPFNKPQHMAAVSKLLTDNNIDRAKYGCFKMKELLAQMDYLKLEDVILGGVPQIMVTLLKHDEYVSDSCTEQESIATDIPTETLEEFCNLPPKPIGIILGYLKAKGQNLSPTEVREALCEDFEKARAGKVRFYDGKMIYPCRYMKSDGTPVEITLKRSTYEGKPWFLNYIDTQPRFNSGKSVYPGKQLEGFAFLGSWSSFLAELAEKAIHEEWDFANAVSKDYHILIQYIKYTFYRLTREKKVCISDDGMFAAFNTGLVDKHYDDLYACFVPNDPDSETKWKFSGFCTAASRDLGKQLVYYFNPLPQPPKYFKNKEDLIFDLEKPIHPDYDHIIIDNIRRLPLKFLTDQFTDCTEAQRIASLIPTADRYTKSSLYEQLKTIICDNSRLFIRIQNRIKDSIELARKRVRWNYKTAIPSYYPKSDSMSLMLPLCLVDEEVTDVALVVELTQSGNYQGQTIITMAQAYIDARLLCRLNSDWLSPVQPAASDSFDEEIE